MPARRCPLHGIDFESHVMRCPVCDEQTVYLIGTSPDKNWREQVEEIERRRPVADADVTCWRLYRLLELGVDREDAEHLSARRDVDVHALAALLDRGCNLELAIRIVA